MKNKIEKMQRIMNNHPMVKNDKSKEIKISENITDDELLNLTNKFIITQLNHRGRYDPNFRDKVSKKYKEDKNKRKFKGLLRLIFVVNDKINEYKSLLNSLNQLKKHHDFLKKEEWIWIKKIGTENSTQDENLEISNKIEKIRNDIKINKDKQADINIKIERLKQIITHKKRQINVSFSYHLKYKIDDNTLTTYVYNYLNW